MNEETCALPEVHTESEHALHKDLYRTLVLLAIDGKERPIYFVAEGLATYDPREAPHALQDHERYFYEEVTCPTNFIGPHSSGNGVVALYEGGDRDPHGVFRFVRAVWMPQRYVDAKREYEGRGHNMGWCPEDVLEDLFPELIEGQPRRCLHQGKTGNTGFCAVIGLDGNSRVTGSGEYTEVHYVAPGETCDHPDRVVR